MLPYHVRPFFFWSCKLKACYVSIPAIYFWFIFVKMHRTPPDPPHHSVTFVRRKRLFLSNLGFPYIKCAVFQCKVISYLWNINPWGKYFRIHCCQSCRAGISKLSFTRTLFTHLLHTFWQYSRGVRRVGDQNIDTILVQCLKAGRVLDYGYWPSFNL